MEDVLFNVEQVFACDYVTAARKHWPDEGLVKPEK